MLVSLVVACQPQAEEEIGAAPCRVVTHAAGTACIPESIQRLVTLDGVTFEYAIAAGLSPIGTAVSGLMDHLAEQVTQVENVGVSGEPNLERVLALKPDLIVGLDYNQSAYAQASQIAPTLLFEFEHSGQWKTVFQQFAAALNQAEVAQQTLADYEARLATFKAQMGERLNTLQVSVVRIYPDTINLYLRDSFVGIILQDAGLARPPAQNIGAEEATARFGNPIQTSISRELLAQADGDVIFVWTSENTPEAAATAQQNLQSLQQDPLWQQLKAVQAGRVYQVPSYWIGSGPIAANAVVGDLLKTHSGFSSPPSPIAEALSSLHFDL
ncbi:ABC transporter substrate-binding protein [Synechococcales cyanobacterium C]|uniref:ABC transporter substrate-binding protein n=2 Tax=Petrachloros TaxID=2918834 RepID=A0A8K2A0G3_9CYAN|nr:ABC transporter substrate-binding protein [Petrachloros mirabilis ULC683]